MKSVLTATAALLALAACSPSQDDAQTTNQTQNAAQQSVQQNPQQNSESFIEFSEFQLENGLKVVFHTDRSDPVVAVALTAHVGSAREIENRTGFAHLFEHLLFLESENLGKGGLDAMSARIGGSGANGSTSRDRTNYFQTVPKDALEKMIWAEADKLGWFINTVTEPVLAKEKQVVKNEKRQGVDNRPYGHNNYVVHKNLYPEGHPYSWQVIGSLEDLQAATLQDVKDFYNAWYTPNNVTLVIAGDFDEAQARDWVEKYFAEIPRGPEIEPLAKQPATLTETKSLFHEDNYARQPQLSLVWPTVPQYDADMYALNVLMDLLAEGKDAPMNAVLIDEQQLTANVAMYGYQAELAGEHWLQVRAFADTDLDTVKDAIDAAFARFEEEGVDPADLERVKTQQEVSFYQGVQTVLGKAFALAQYEIFAGDPGFVNQAIENIRAVTAEDVMTAYDTYIKDKPYVATSFVPEGQPELALEGAVRAEVVIEPIVQGAEETFDASIQAEYERTPSSFDRTVEPPYGEAPALSAPDIWTVSTDNGLQIYGLEDSELPLVRFELSLLGGQLLDDPEAPGAANLLAELLDKGTADKTPAEFEEAVAALGATLNVSAGRESITIEGSTLSRNYLALMALVEEMILTPRWDAEEFDLAKNRVISQIQFLKSDPNALAASAFSYVVYGDDHIFGQPQIGSESSVQAMTLEDVQAFHAGAVAPQRAIFRVVGDLDQEAALSALGGLSQDWSAESAPAPDYAIPAEPETSTVYFYDVPGASQSVLRFGYPSVTRDDPDYYPIVVANYILGGGGFASRLTQELREGKGYTYGIGSGLNSGRTVGEFVISSGVRANVTLEAADLVVDILRDYPATFTEEDLAVTKSFLVKSKARSTESLNAKLNVLQAISEYGLPADYLVEETEIVETMTLERIRELAETHIRPDAMNYIVVGDAETQAGRLTELGYGEPVMVKAEVDARLD